MKTKHILSNYLMLALVFGMGLTACKKEAHETTGEIEGEVAPMDAKPTIYAINGTDSTSTTTDKDGDFKIKNLKPGTYSVWFKATPPYKDTTLTNVVVTVGKETELAKITLHQ